MDWLVFADDWGAHPSTTQHLVRGLPDSDRVLWAGSLGMRAPRLSAADARRVAGRLRELAVGSLRAVRRGLRDDGARCASAGEPSCRFRAMVPPVLPWHRQLAPLNRRLLGRVLRRHLGEMGMREVQVLASNPVAELYLDALPTGRVVYLRLDDYARLPGVDADLVVPLERELMRRADAIFVTACSLLPTEPSLRAKATYLPQGVDIDHFGRLPLAVPTSRTLGFFGLVAEWLDFDLVARVAEACPDWTLELLGPARHHPEALDRLPNVRFVPGVPYDVLPDRLGHWRAAWAPFVVSDLTRSVNPLKVREYLAAGLSAACTPLPEVAALAPHVVTVRDAADVVAWLDEVLATDSPDARALRRGAVRGDGWSERASLLRRSVVERQPEREEVAA